MTLSFESVSSTNGITSSANGGGNYNSVEVHNAKAFSEGVMYSHLRVHSPKTPFIQSNATLCCGSVLKSTLKKAKVGSRCILHVAQIPRGYALNFCMGV